MQIKHQIKSIVLKTPIYSAWVALQKYRQQKEFQSVLAKIHGLKNNDDSLARALSIRGANRRVLSSRPRILALGHEAWEQHGLWPSFGRIADFHFFPLDLINGTWSEKLRDQMAQSILSRLDELERERPVEMVFIYADSAFLAPDMLRELSRRNIWTVLMGLDDKHKFSPHTQFGMQTGQSFIAPLVDVYWTTWKAAVPLFWEIGARPLYLAEGADPNFHHPIEMNRDIDVLFLGARYGVRGELVAFLRSHGINVAAFGKGWPTGYVSFEKSIELINRSRVVLGIGGVGHLDGVQHLKGRDFEVPMCGAVYITSYNPELADWYAIGDEILCYSSPQNCVETLNCILRDTQKQMEIRNAALLRSLRDHTWESRLHQLFGMLRTVDEQK